MQLIISTSKSGVHSLMLMKNGRPVCGYCTRSHEKLEAKYRQLLRKVQIFKHLHNN